MRYEGPDQTHLCVTKTNLQYILLTSHSICCSPERLSDKNLSKCIYYNNLKVLKHNELLLIHKKDFSNFIQVQKL